MGVATAIGLDVATIAFGVAVAPASMCGSIARNRGAELGTGVVLAATVGVTGFAVGVGCLAGVGVDVGAALGDSAGEGVAGAVGVAVAAGGADGKGVTTGIDACASAVCAGRCGALPPPKKCASTPPKRRPASITTRMSGKTGSPLAEGSSSLRRRRGGSLPFRASAVRQARPQARPATRQRALAAAKRKAPSLP